MHLDAQRPQLGASPAPRSALAPGGALDPAQLGERAAEIAALQRADLDSLAGAHAPVERAWRAGVRSRPHCDVERSLVALAGALQRGRDEASEQAAPGARGVT